MRNTLLKPLSLTALLTLPFASAATLTWDHDADGTASDGGGTWLGANQWVNGGPATWNNATPDSAIIGSNGTAGTIDLTGGVTVQDATFDNFTGKYIVANDLLTLNGTLTWGPNTTASGNNEGVRFDTSASLAGTGTIVVDGNYPVDKSRGQFDIRQADSSAFSGTWDVRNGVLFTEGSFRPSATSNIIMNGGPGASQGAVYSSRWGQTLDRALGTGANQIQVLGNRSGFEGQGTTGLNVLLDGTGNQQVQWGSADFNPSVLLLQSPNANSNGNMTFNTALDLNGADRTIEVDKDHVFNISTTDHRDERGRARIPQPITNGLADGNGGLIKEGPGRLSLAATNTYDGGTTVNEGQIHYERADAMPSSGTHTFNDGIELWIDIGGGDDFGTGAGTAAGTLGGLLAGTGPGTSTVVYNGQIDLLLRGGTTIDCDIPDLGSGGTGVWFWASSTITGNNTHTGFTRVGRRASNAATLTLGSATALAGQPDLEVDSAGTSRLELNGFDATIGQLRLGSNNGGQQGTVQDTAGGGVLTVTGGILLDSHNDGGGRVDCDTLDLNGTTQLFKHTGNNRSTPDLIIGADIQNGGVTTNATAGQSEIYLNGTNTYTGGTTHEAGRLVVNGSLADATMSITGGNVQGSGTLTFNIVGSAIDQVVTSGGSIDISGMTCEVLGTPTETEYILIDATGAGSYSGTFAGSTLPAGYSLDYGTANIVKIVGTPGGSPFDTWAALGTGVTFEGDANGDGVQDGLAFVLGVPDPDDDANSALPTVTEDGSGGLVLTFNCLPSGDRAPAQLRIEHSSDLGGSDAWLATVDEVPDATDAVADNGVTFVVTPGSPTNAVVATIGASEAAGGKLFGRLTATE